MPSSERNADLESRAVELRERAAALAGRLHATGKASTTVGRERAVLRLLGVSGLDAAGRPLAQEVADRFAALGPARLGGGIALPFAAAAREYDLEPQELALEVAAGHVDLSLEAELLRDPERRAAAEATAEAWLVGAWRRFSAQRTARGELRALLGEPGPTYLGAEAAGADAGAAERWAAQLVGIGADLILVRVPRDRELRQGLGEQLDPPEMSEDPRPAPPGSQRGLGLLRAALDDAAAEAGHYAALASYSVGLAAPDQAVVAGLERIDLVFSDPLEPVVAFGLSPERAIADHAFAIEVHARSGATLVLGPGPVAVAPEMARGQPLGPATQAGRALALQALALELSRCGSLPDARIQIEAPMAGLDGGPGEARSVAEIQLRRVVFPDHRLALLEPDSSDPMGWPLRLLPSLAGGPPPALVLRGPSIGPPAVALIADLAGALAAAAALDAARQVGGLRGPALDHARAVLAEALTTLRMIATDGWDWLLRIEPVVSHGAKAGLSRPRVAAAAPVPLRDALDPFGLDLAAGATGATGAAVG